MKRYEVIESFLQYRKHIVDADSEEEAKEKVWYGETYLGEEWEEGIDYDITEVK